MFHLERVRLHAVPRHVHLDRVDARVPLSAGRDRTATRNGEAATVDPATRGSHLSRTRDEAVAILWLAIVGLKFGRVNS